MKKVLAIVLALVIALGCASMAFAVATPSNATGTDTPTEPATEATPTDPEEIKYDIQSLLNTLKGLFTGDAELADLWDQISGLVKQLWDKINVFGCSASDVLGAADDLEAKIESLPIVGDIYKTIKNIINTIKEKIKALYSGSFFDGDETEAAESVDTGSNSVGIVAFAAVSVAAAAAYVCTKKRD